MLKLNQRGVIHLLIPIILLLGLVAGVYLVTSGNPLKLFSKASVSIPVGPEVSFTLKGPNFCSGGWTCLLTGKPQPEEEFEVQVYARSDIEQANLFTAKMTFPKDLVEVKKIKEEGFIKNWVENYFDNTTGEIDLAGGMPTPGYKTQTGGESALMATIVFKAKTLGKGTVSFTDSSAIYSNLNNINILTITRPYEISVEVAPSPSPTSEPIPSSSPTPYPSASIVPTPGTKGDGNKDGKINLIDMSVLHTDYGKTQKVVNFRDGIDMNSDGLVNAFDFSLLRDLLAKLGVIKVAIPVPPPTITPTPSQWVNVTYPNGGETFNVGDTINVTWQGNGSDTYSVYLDGAGPGSGAIIWNLSSNVRSYSWNTSNFASSLIGRPLKIIVIGIKGSNQVKDLSDSTFVINPANKRVFVTSSTYNGNLGGLSGADTKCQASADGVKLDGTWKAWLSDSSTSAASRLNHNAGVYQLLNGKTVAANWTDLTDGSLQIPINLTEKGESLSGGVTWSVWTNTAGQGDRWTFASTSCSNWSSGLSTQIGIVGNVNGGYNRWSDSGGETIRCNLFSRLYCFEQ